MPDLAAQATQAALKGEWQTAAELNSLILSENSQDVEASNRLAHAYTVLGKIKEAKKIYQRVLTIDPYNHIAQKNLKKLHEAGGEISENSTPYTPCLFLEEPGKTKVTNIVNPAPQKVLSLLTPGTSLELGIKKHTVLLFKSGEYVGALPDDVAHRLIYLARLGNKYQAYLKAVERNNLLVFLQEIKRSKRVGNQPSFPLGKSNGFYPFVHSKQALGIDKEPPERSTEDEEEITDEGSSKEEI